MQIVFTGDNLYEMLKPVFLSAENFTQSAKR